MDVARADTAATELDRLIERRSSGEPDPDEQEELWQESVRAYNARRNEEMRAARVEYHRGQAVRLRAALEDLIRQHEAQARMLLTEADA